MKQSVEDRVAAIEARNARVELDKAWETSLMRRASIAYFTYGIAVGFLLIIDNPDPFTNALVPVGGYLLSTSAMRKIRLVWEIRQSK